MLEAFAVYYLSVIEASERALLYDRLAYNEEQKHFTPPRLFSKVFLLRISTSFHHTIEDDFQVFRHL